MIGNRIGIIFLFSHKIYSLIALVQREITTCAIIINAKYHMSNSTFTSQVNEW